MAAGYLLMRRLRELPRLKYESRLPQRAIARACRVGLGTVTAYLQRAVAAGVTWPMPGDLDGTALEARLFLRPALATDRTLPAWAEVHQELKKPGVTLTLLWQEHRAAPLRQLLIRDLGHDEPTILVTNDLRGSPKSLITRYARRVLIENGLADAIDFFHLDALSSAVALNVDFDVLLTVVASGIYRQFAHGLRWYERAHARQLFRRVLDTTGRVVIADDGVTVTLPRPRRSRGGVGAR